MPAPWIQIYPGKIVYLVEQKGKLHCGVVIKGKKGQLFEENCKGRVEIIDTEFS